MTIEEVIKIAKGLRTDFKCESDTMVDFCNTIIKALEQQPCEDCISREAVNDGFKKYENGSFAYGCVWGYINELPSVTPKEKSEYEHDHEVVKAYNDGQAYILDKIKAEVGLLGKDYLGCPQPQVVCDDVIKIIDKYRGE